jgi:PAS domain S-box-containing protein
VTNALVHAGTEVEVTARVQRAGVRVEVRDGSPHLPTKKHYASLTATGRGLHLLEQMVDRWGVDPHDQGKTVWFELGTEDIEPRGAAPGPGSAGAGADDAGRGVVVELRNVPLLLHAAWQMQAESLLREYLLSQLDDDNGTDQIERHAAAADALALLREQLPRPQIGDDPNALMSAAVEPRVSTDRVVLMLPGPSVPHFQLLQELLDTAIDMADAGDLLTPPTQPEIQAFRRWLCTEVTRQVEGARPRPWDGDVEGASAPRAAAPWDPHVVADAPTAKIAADDTNRILAVSRAGLALLGYGNPAELVHRRLVEIIPHRYRQAHLAGFTLHLFAGRSPLLSTSVVVPALRRDGSEVTVGLTVTAQHLPEGRRVFVADLREAAAPEA